MMCSTFFCYVMHGDSGIALNSISYKTTVNPLITAPRRMAS